MTGLNTIFVLALERQFTIRTIRFYEDFKLISPLRQITRGLLRFGDYARLSVNLPTPPSDFLLDEIAENVDIRNRGRGEFERARGLIFRIIDR